MKPWSDFHGSCDALYCIVRAGNGAHPQSPDEVAHVQSLLVPCHDGVRRGIKALDVGHQCIKAAMPADQ